MKRLLFIIALALPMVALAQTQNLAETLRTKIERNLALPSEISLLSTDQIAEYHLDSISLSLMITKKGNIDLTKSGFLHESVKTINSAFIRAVEDIRISRKFMKSDTLLIINFNLTLTPINDTSNVYNSRKVTYKA